MKLSSIALALVSTFAGLAAAKTGQVCPVHEPSISSKLSECKTASAFCKSVLGTSSRFTYTRTSTTTSLEGTRTTTAFVTKSKTRYTSTTATTIPTLTSTDYVTTVVTKTEMPPKCSKPPTKRALENEPRENRLKCGKQVFVDEKHKVKDACRCFIARTTTLTVTLIEGPLYFTTTTETKSDIIKTVRTETYTPLTIETVTTTSTATVCKRS